MIKCDKVYILGLKCKSCKYKCHRDCELRVLPSCGMPSEYIDAVRQILEGSPSPLLAPRIMMPSPGRLTPRDKRRLHSGGNPLINYANPDSSSTTSSCSSSTPSSPALLGKTMSSCSSSICSRPVILGKATLSHSSSTPFSQDLLGKTTSSSNNSTPSSLALLYKTSSGMSSRSSSVPFRPVILGKTFYNSSFLQSGPFR